MLTRKFWLLCLCPHRPHTLFLSHLKFGSDMEPLEACLRSYHLQTPKSPTIISGKYRLDPIQNPYSSSLSRSSFWLVKAKNWRKKGLHPPHLDRWQKCSFPLTKWPPGRGVILYGEVPEQPEKAPGFSFPWQSWWGVGVATTSADAQ